MRKEGAGREFGAPLWNSGPVQFAILGPLEVTGDDGRVIPVVGGRLRALLTRLALDAGTDVPAGDLEDALWPENPPANVANALQSLVSRLRRALGDPALIQQARLGYRLAVPPDRVDIERFVRLAAAGREALQRSDYDDAVRALRDADGRWRGTPLADADDALYAEAPRARFEQFRLAATTDRLEAEIALGRAAAVIGEIEELVAAYPIREKFVALQMTALADCGRTAEALLAYDALRERLADALGTDPEPENQALHLALLRGEHRGRGEVGGGGEHGEHRDRESSGRESADHENRERREQRAGAATHTDDPVHQQTERARRSDNLPASTSSLIGRDTELDRVRGSVRTHRLTTIVGPGGAGKTRLAVAAAAALVEDHRDGVWLVELAPVTDRAALAQTILGVIGQRAVRMSERFAEPGAATVSANDRLFDTLAQSDALLVVDNCEHLIGPIAELVADLLARCPALAILATSRELLGTSGEVVIDIPPLGLPPADANATDAAGHPAVQLLVERGKAARGEFALTEESAPAVVEIVRRLDGLPLAIELAAARLRAMTAAQIAERLSDRFRLLTGGLRTAAPRHRTLGAVVDWSWELLTASERLLAERLATFRGDFADTDAVSVCADEALPPAEIPDGLSSLVDKSLIQTSADDQHSGAPALRFRMLETIREYGLAQLAECGLLDAARRRHATHFAAVANRLGAQLRTREQPLAIAAFNRERDNIAAAIRYFVDADRGAEAAAIVLDMTWYWTITDSQGDIDAWTGSVLSLASGVSAPNQAKLKGLRLISRVTAPADDESLPPVELDRQLHQAAADLAAIDDATDALTSLIRVYLDFFASRGAMTHHAVDRGLASADPWVRAMTRVLHVLILENQGATAEMRAELDTALAAVEEVGDQWGSSMLISVRSGLRTIDGDLAGAVEDLQAVLRLLAELSAGQDDMFAHLRLAGIRARQGDFADARRHSQAVRRGRPGTPVPMERTLLADAFDIELRIAEGMLGEAAALAGQLRSRLPLPADTNVMYSHLNALAAAACAAAAVMLGDSAAARRDLDLAYPAVIATHDHPMMATVAMAVALYAATFGDERDAAEILGAAAVLRGGDDATDLMIIEIRSRAEKVLDARAFATHYARGLALSTEVAQARFDPALLGAVGSAPGAWTRS